MDISKNFTLQALKNYNPATSTDPLDKVTKKCCRCKLEIPLRFFHMNKAKRKIQSKNGKDPTWNGFAHYCVLCKQEYMRPYYDRLKKGYQNG